MAYCKICGEYECRKHSILLRGVRKISSFSGSSPPEVFVGRYGYPNVNVGILSPEEHGDTSVMSSAEEWFSRRLGIREVLSLRNKLIYGRQKNYVKRAVLSNKFLDVMKEIAMAHKSVSTEFHLKKPVRKNDERESRVPLISNAGEVERVRLQENVKVKKKVDYLVNDTDVKSVDAMLELEKSGVKNSEMVKLLSAGLLGLKKNRKLVPTRWSITAVDSSLSEKKIDKIRYCPLVEEYMVFHDEYLGNHYEILLMPRYWSFEVIEISIKNLQPPAGSRSPATTGGVWKDFESVFKRKRYAESVTGAYYANRLGVCEHLEKIGRQASVIVFREIRPEYYAPLGVGILRETTRSAMLGEAHRFESLQGALADVQSRLRIPVSRFLKESQMMKEMRQKTLSEWS